MKILRCKIILNNHPPVVRNNRKIKTKKNQINFANK